MTTAERTEKQLDEIIRLLRRIDGRLAAAERLQPRQRLAEDHPQPRPLLDTAGLAEMLDVTPEWIRAHAADYGAIRLHDGRRAPLRFDLQHVLRLLERRRIDQPQAANQPTRRRPGRAHGQAWAESVLPRPKDAH